MLAKIPDDRCFVCAHFLGTKLGPRGSMNERYVCQAFPNGIPKEIAFGDNTHRSPFPGDRGIQFVLEDPAEEVDDDN